MMYLPYAALLAALASAASTPDVPQNKHVKLDFSVSRGGSLSQSSRSGFAALVARDSQLELTNAQTYYSATLKIGANGDENTVLVDTGSSDLWIMASDVQCYAPPSSQKRSEDVLSPFSYRRLLDFEPATPSTNKNNEKRDDAFTSDFGPSVVATTDESYETASTVAAASCTSLGSFNTANSDFRLNASAPEFAIEYGDGTAAIGYWGTDFVNVGSMNVSDVSIAVVNETSSDTGVLGIGLEGLEVTESSSSTSMSYTYENFPIRLKKSGIIEKVVYSLYLNSTEALYGSVLFGAVDHAKYSGQLQTVPLLNIYEDYYTRPVAFYVALDSITLEDSSQNITISTTNIPALLDSGTTLTYLPSEMVASLASSMGGHLTKSGYYDVNCAYNTSSAYAVYNLSGIEIRVPLSDLLLSDGNKCYLAVMDSSPDSLTGAANAILGDNFLRHAYVVYDLEEYEVSLAQINYSNSEDIETVSSSIPSAVKASGYSATDVATTVSPGPSGSDLSTSGLKKSEGTSAVHFAKSLLFGLVGVSLIFML